MSLKEKLQKWLFEYKGTEIPTISRDFEFNAELEDHPLGNQNVYRLYFINYHRIGEHYGMMGHDNVGIIDRPFMPFLLPDCMKREDAFKVLSYLSDFIEKELHLESCSYKSVASLDKVIDLKRLGFSRLNRTLDDNSVIDLYTITGRIKLFKDSKQYEKYFEWYTEGVTFDEVKSVYSRCSIEFYDLTLTAKEDGTSYEFK